ncbi:MAG: hypothetical protein ALECFALPRED_001236 [Alectoria fallacina]|uniref:Uncharacterized protein n=1 Tax=Alectoria fallacina TaxID=1903189 RepID=A0A8H3JB61_9LECA|nr:MAG: hypothetical protein ALECFALPRED_001236 [Alectoria fallacina]
MNIVNATTISHAMSPSQSPSSMEPPFINLNQSEMSIVQSMRKDPCGKWSCKLCDSQFGSIMRLVTHLLTSCDQHSSLSTFSTMSAIHICTFFDEPGSIKMLECYIRVARENPDIMASNLDNDTDSEVSELANDTDSEVSGLDEGDHVGSLEPKNEDEEGTGPVWFVKDEKEGLLDQEEEEEEEEESTMDENATPKAKPQKAKKSKVVAKAVRAPRNQEFPAMPPHSLSADAKLEWTFRRDRAGEIREIIKTNLKPNTKKIDEDACLAAWNASLHPFSWNANSSTAQPYKNYRVLGSRESRDRGRLRDLTKAAEMAEKAQQQQQQ